MVGCQARDALPPRKDPSTNSTGGLVGLWPVWMGTENFVPTGVRTSDRPASSMSLYWLSYPGRLQATFIVPFTNSFLYVRSSIQSHTTLSCSTNVAWHLTYGSTWNQSNNQFYFQEQRLDFVLRIPYLLSHNPIKEPSSCMPLAYSTTAPARRMWTWLHIPHRSIFTANKRRRYD